MSARKGVLSANQIWDVVNYLKKGLPTPKGGPSHEDDKHGPDDHHRGQMKMDSSKRQCLSAEPRLQRRRTGLPLRSGRDVSPEAGSEDGPFSGAVTANKRQFLPVAAVPTKEISV